MSSGRSFLSEEFLLEAIDINKSYRLFKNEIEVLKGISLKIFAAELVAITGPSGAGKSTLLHILGGLDYPSGGKVYFQKQDIYQLKDNQRAQIRNKYIGFVFQFYHLLPEFSAWENVMLPALIKNNNGNKIEYKNKAIELLEQVGLSKRVNHKPNELSGGEQQRVAIARSLINEPKIIFCDEPTGNLDSTTGKEIVDLLLSFNRKNKQALVMVTHDESIAKLAHRVIQIKDGKMV